MIRDECREEQVDSRSLKGENFNATQQAEGINLRINPCQVPNQINCVKDYHTVTHRTMNYGACNSYRIFFKILYCTMESKGK